MLARGIHQLVREFPDPVLIVSTGGDILAANHKAAHLLGFEQDQPASLQSFVADPPQRLTDFLGHCARTSENTPGAFLLQASPHLRYRFEGSGMSLEPEVDANDPDAAQTLRRCVWLRILSHQQAVGAYLAVNRRIERLLGALHDRTRAEQALRSRTAQFEALLNQSPLGIYLVDSKLRILQMNPTAAESLGALAFVGEPLEEAFKRILPSSFAEATLRHFLHTLETGEPHIVDETPDQRRGREGTGKYYSWQLHRIPLTDDTFGLVCYFQDISVRKQAEEALRRTEKLAAVGRLAASVAHEINNPLEAVTNLLYIARADSTLTDETRQYLTQADTELARIAYITRQTLGFYRDSTAPVLFQPATAIESVLSLYEHRFDARRVRLVRDLAPTPPIYAFLGEFRQVIANLIMNAHDAMDPRNTVGEGGGVLTVRTRPFRGGGARHAGVRITIADTGSGIAPDRIERIFDAFFTTKKDTGTGLGLWLSQEIVQKHEGAILVRSRIGHARQGTAFTIFWPSHPVSLSASGAQRSAITDPGAAATAQHPGAGDHEFLPTG